MQVIVCKNYEEVSLKAADLVSETVKANPSCVLGLATGGTPEGMYQLLCDRYAAGELDFSGVTSVNLDEYYPIEPDNPQSYRYFMNHHLFDHINIDKNRTYVPCGTATDPDRACEEYEQIIASVGGIDLQILGIGQNGHIAFNEPDDALYPKTHKTALTQNTIEANARFFDSMDQVPKHALTMGMGSILGAKKIVMLVCGKGKREALRAVLSGRVSTWCPASFLALHKDVIILCDREAYDA